jgi:hypothetical protein
MAALVCVGVAVLAADRHGPDDKGEAPKNPAPSPWVAFQEVAKVLHHPRCQNCHPAGDAPLQGENSELHHDMVKRDGPKCVECHLESSQRGKSKPPGVKGWRMPPKETPMIFQRRTPEQLCAQLKDRSQNGDRSLPDILKHVEKDPLVLYGWDPGEGREKVPVKHDRFLALMKQWIDGGAPCADAVGPSPAPTPK